MELKGLTDIASLLLYCIISFYQDCFTLSPYSIKAKKPGYYKNKCPFFN